MFHKVAQKAVGSVADRKRYKPKHADTRNSQRH